ncbi:MAG: branched-chain amino acid ABC transporter permease [Desulfatibacillaceae bacterium]
MSTTWLPCGKYHETYSQDHQWWPTWFIRGKMLLLFLFVFVLVPVGAMYDRNVEYFATVLTMVGYTAMGAMGVQLLIGYAGLITLGHAAFIAIGAYISTLLVLQFPWPQFLLDWGLAYPLSIIAGAVGAGLWSVLFGLPSARVKGFYLILTTMAAQFITVDFIITQYISQVGGRGQAFSVPPGAIKFGPWTIDTEIKVYLLMAVLALLMTVIMANLLRSRAGRAWVAIRDNDIAAETMGINVIWHRLTAFFVAGAMGGVAGAFWVSNTAAISPEHFPWSWSLWLVGVILIGGVGTIHGTFYGSLFMVVIVEALQWAVIPLADSYPKLLIDFAYLKEMAFGLAICAFLIFEPNGLAYRWWQLKNYFNLWPFSY